MTAALDGLGFTFRKGAPDDSSVREQGRAFSIAAAGALAALMAVMLIIGAGLKDWLGAVSAGDLVEQPYNPGESDGIAL